MKPLFFLVLISLAIVMIGGVSAVGIYPAVDPDMVLYYHFNNDSAYGENDTHVYDFSGNGNNGTANNTQFVVGDGILGDGAMSFNGVNGSIKILDSDSLDFQNDSTFTISAWINPLSFSLDSDSWILAKGNTNQYSYGLSVSTGKRLRFYAYKNSGSQHCLVTSSNFINLGSWQYVSAVINSTSCSLFENGILSGSSSRDYSLNMSDTSSKLFIGKREDNAGYYFNGSIDEVAIYNYSLSDNDILSNYRHYVTCGSSPTKKCRLYFSTILNKSTYYLNGTGNQGGIDIANDNIELDGNGSTIYYANDDIASSYGITAVGRNITIKNIILIQGNSSLINAKAINSYNAPDLSISNVSIVTLNNASYGMYIRNSSNCFISNNNLSTYGWASYGIHLEVGTSNCLVSNNLVISNASNSYHNYAMGIFLELDTNNNTILNNTIFAYGSDSRGIAINVNASNNNVSRNNIKLEGNNCYGLYVLEDSLNSPNYNNWFFDNSVNVSGSNCSGIKVSGEGSSNNSFINNYIYSDSIGILLDDTGMPYSNNNFSSFNYFDSNNIYSSSYGISIKKSQYNLFLNNTLHNNVSILLNSFSSYNGFSFINKVLSYFSKDDSINSFNYLTSALLHNSTSICNGSSSNIALNTGEINITLSPNDYCYVLDEFNLTETEAAGLVDRQNSPMVFINDDNTTKYFTSFLVDEITNLTISVDTDNCTISSIEYTPVGSITPTIILPADFTCASKLTFIAPSVTSSQDECDPPIGENWFISTKNCVWNTNKVNPERNLTLENNYNLTLTGGANLTIGEVFINKGSELIINKGSELIIY